MLKQKLKICLDKKHKKWGGYLVVQYDSRRKQDVDKQVEISEEKRFVDHFGCHRN